MNAPDGRWPPPPGRPDHPPPATTMALAARVRPADVPELCDRLAALLRASPATVVFCDVGAITEPDADTLDALARLQLTARRLGSQVRLHQARDRLRALLVFTGLTEALPLAGGPLAGGPLAGGVLADRPALEPHRQAEQREQPGGVEEGADARDPPG